MLELDSEELPHPNAVSHGISKRTVAQSYRYFGCGQDPQKLGVRQDAFGRISFVFREASEQ
jgi:hypothetical protein